MESLREIIEAILGERGLLIGIFAGFLKVGLTVRNKTFKWQIALLDFLACPPAAWISYGMAVETGYSTTVASAWALFISLNAFFIVNMITDHEKLEALVNKYFDKTKK